MMTKLITIALCFASSPSVLGEDIDPVEKERRELLTKAKLEHHQLVTKVNQDAIDQYKEVLAIYTRKGDLENAKLIHKKIETLQKLLPEAPKVAQVAPPKVAPAENEQFIEQFTYGGKKYALLTKTGNFEEASIECTKLGGHLLSIDNEEKYSFFKEYLASKKATVWLDLTDSANEGEWLNFRQKPAKFLKWHINEPNGKKKQNHVMWPFQGKWDMRDTEGTVKLQILCEW